MGDSSAQGSGRTGASTPSGSRSTAPSLSAKQARFVAEYLKDCNAKQAAIRAGYSPHTAETCGPRLLRNARVASAVAAGQAKRLDKAIATRAERQKFWTEVMSDAAGEMRDRLKASELLGKSEADFTDNLRHQGDLNITVVSDAPPKEFDR